MPNNSDTKGLTGKDSNYLTIPIPGELEAMNERGVTVAAGTVYDYNQEKFQQTINEDFEDRISDIEENGGGTIYIIKANENFEYGGNTYRLTEGYIDQKDVYDDDTLLRESGYTDDEYTTMYNNARAVEAAIKYAYENGYGGVKFEKGDYCFTPERISGISSGHRYPSINIYNLSNFDIDFGGSTFYYLLDSDYTSEYYIKVNNNDDAYVVWSYMFFISNSQYITIHNGHFVGDRVVRKFTDTGEFGQEQTYGITIGAFCRYITIRNMDTESFMGDGIAWFGNYFDDENGFINECLATPSSNIPVKAYRKKYVYKLDNGVTTIVEDNVNYENCAVTEIISLNNLYTRSNVGVYKCFKDEKLYFLGRVGSAFQIDDGAKNVLSNAYPDIDVITYGDDDDTPIRIIQAKYLNNFKLLKNETRVRLQFYHEDVLKNAATSGYYDEEDGDYYDENSNRINLHYDDELGYYVEKSVNIREGNGYHVLIEMCMIHDNHRGGYTGDSYELTIRNCKFEKSNPIPVDKTGVPSLFWVAGGQRLATRYHIDIEDVPSWGIILDNNIFVSYANNDFVTTGSVILPASTMATITNNVFHGAELKIGECCDALIDGNILYKLEIDPDRYKANGDLRYKYSDLYSGSLYKKREITLNNNIINRYIVLFSQLRNTLLRSCNNYYKGITFQTDSNLSFDMSITASFVNDIISFRYIPSGSVNATYIYRVPLQLFRGCTLIGADDYLPSSIPTIKFYNFLGETSFAKVENNIFKNLNIVPCVENSMPYLTEDVIIKNCVFINADITLTLTPNINLVIDDVKGFKLRGKITPIANVDVDETYKVNFKNILFTERPQFGNTNNPNFKASFNNCSFDYEKNNNCLFTLDTISGSNSPDITIKNCNIDSGLVLWDGGNYAYDESSNKPRIVNVVMNSDKTIQAKFNEYYMTSGGAYTLTITLPNTYPTDYTSKFTIFKKKGITLVMSGANGNIVLVNVDSEDMTNAVSKNCIYELSWNGGSWLVSLIEIPINYLITSSTNADVFSVCLAQNWCDQDGMTYEDASAVTQIGEAFRGNTDIVTFDEFKHFGVTEIPSYAFYGDTGITSIELPENLTKIGTNAFRGMTSLTEIILPDSITEIGSYAFQQSGLQSLTIPKNVEKIGTQLAYQCGSLTSLTFEPTTPPQITGTSVDISYLLNGTATIYVPYGCKAAYVSAFGNYSGWTQSLENRIVELSQ